MSYDDDNEIIGTVNNSVGTYTLLDPGRYCFTPKRLAVVKNNFYKEGQVEIDQNGKERVQNKEQYQITFKVSDPSAPDEFFCEENGDEISHTEWYSKRDDNTLTPKMRTYRLFAALLGGDKLPDNADLRRATLLGGRINAVIAHVTSQDGKTVRGKIAKDTETPFAVPGARKFGTKAAAKPATAAAAATAVMDGDDIPF